VSFSGTTQYSAVLSQWNLSAEAGDDVFSFDPPAGSSAIEFLPPADEEIE